MRFFVLFLCVFAGFSFLTKAESLLIAPVDSVGHKWENGKLYVLHKVEKGQTAFSISKRYGASVDALKTANGGTSEVKVGQIVKVPYSRFRRASGTETKAAAAAAAPKAPSADAGSGTSIRAQAGGTHTVEVGNTLYNIASRYGVTVSDIKAWNGLTSDQVMLGQVLIISSGKFAENNEAPKVSAASLSDTAKMPVAEKVVKAEPIVPAAPKMLNIKSIRQQGLAEKIDVGGASPKYLALHRSAPIGTLIQITNQANQEVIWAKVIGRIPDTSNNDDIVVKLSSSAFDKISPQTRRFRAEITYSDKSD